jgi:hypothetical protein
MLIFPSKKIAALISPQADGSKSGLILFHSFKGMIMQYSIMSDS